MFMVRLYAKGKLSVAVKKQFYNPKVKFVAKLSKYLYKNTKKNTTLCVNSCIKVVFWWAEVDSNLEPDCGIPYK